MDMSLLDALLGFALAYSATYVLYCWIRSEGPATKSIPLHAHARTSPDTPSPGNSSSAV